jgi:lysophospholipase L1-like esterase
MRPLLKVSAVFGALLAVIGASPTAQAADFNPPKRFYLALGDSWAFGAQLGRFFQELATGTYDPSTFNTGYVDDFAAKMRSIDPSLETVNLSCPGETTASFMGTCLFKTLGLPLHASYQGSQESAALAFLRAHPGEVSPITIDLGFVDALLPCAGPTFLVDVACIHGTMPAALQSVAVNLPRILADLHRASPSSEIIVMGYYNPFYIQDPTTDALVRALNREIADIADDQDLRVANTFAPFNRTGDETSTLCALTLMCPGLDYHASDAGYRVIAKKFWAVSGYSRLDD